MNHTNENIKICKACGKEKPLANYRLIKSKAKGGWLASYCQLCDRLKSKESMSKKMGIYKGGKDNYGFSKLKINQAKSRAKKEGLEFNLDPEWMVAKIRDGKCEVTGIPFSYGPPINGKRINPWLPSIDRIESSKGYTKDNCQIVIAMFNIAKSEWDMDQFLLMVNALSKKVN